MQSLRLERPTAEVVGTYKKKSKTGIHSTMLLIITFCVRTMALPTLPLNTDPEGPGLRSGPPRPYRSSLCTRHVL